MGNVTSRAAQKAKEAMGIAPTTMSRNANSRPNKDNDEEDPLLRECEEELPKSDMKDKESDTETYNGESNAASSTNNPSTHDEGPV
jgi:hypothetical protein